MPRFDAYDRQGRHTGLKLCPGSGFDDVCDVMIPLLKRRCAPCADVRITRMKADRGKRRHKERKAALKKSPERDSLDQ